MSVSNLMRDVQRICDHIDNEWQKAGRTLEAFPDIVWTHTAQLDLTPLGVLSDTIQLLEDPEIAKLQQASTFSDLYLRLYDNGHFWVEILNWWRSDINVHDHDFSGVQFQLLGDSLNFQYEFVPDTEYDDIRFGELTIKSAARWQPGSRSLVLPGRQAPHNVCHLGFPTLSLLIRTQPRAAYGPQWNYFPPGVAASYNVADVCFRKRVKALRLLAQNADSRQFVRAFHQYVASLDLRQLLFTLLKMIDFLFEPRHVHLIHALLDTDQPYIAETVEAVSRHRASEIIKSHRWSPAVTHQARELFALLGSCFDADIAASLAPHLIANLQTDTISTTLYDNCQALPEEDATLLSGCLDLFRAKRPIAAVQ